MTAEMTREQVALTLDTFRYGEGADQRLAERRLGRMVLAEVEHAAGILARRFSRNRDDVVSLAIERVWLGVVHRFDVDGGRRLRTFVFEGVHFALVDEHRRATAQRRGSGQAHVPVDSLHDGDLLAPHDPEADVVATESLYLIAEVLDAASPAVRETFERHVRGEPGTAIAEAIGCHPSQVTRRLQAVERAVRAALASG